MVPDLMVDTGRDGERLRQQDGSPLEESWWVGGTVSQHINAWQIFTAPSMGSILRFTYGYSL